jgi:hypothetical protein
MTIGEIMTAVVIFICTSILSGIFLLLKKQVSRILDRVNHLTACSFVMFEAFKEQGVNGDVKIQMDKLKEQVIKD